MWLGAMRFPSATSLKKLRSSYLLYRTKSSLGLWQEDITTEIKLKIEKHWAKEVLPQHEKLNTESHYVLPMFPYPSGNLHMGHVRVYSISDTIARFQKLEGKNVIHPIGWDAFGLPAENAAIERNVIPQEWTNSNIHSMKKQLLHLGYDFDWNREISTCDPKYYKWTQYIFLKLFERNLAYQSKAVVNWDPVDKTVLADEQVDEFGCSWRSGAKVEKRNLTQWFIRTTKFAKNLYEGLNAKYLDNWNDIINLQKHWIGECNGVVVTFKIKLKNKATSFDIWTPDPFKLIHGQFIVISKNNVIMQDVAADSTKLTIINPITNLELPVYVSDDVQYPEGRDAYLACAQADPNDKILAKKLNISIDLSDKLIDIMSENLRAIEIAKSKNVGGHFVSSKLKDWLISRQRYWGTPIPIIHCRNCGAVSVPYEDLPVVLPECKSSGIQTLDKFDDWVNCKCPKCQQNAKRETDTMDTFVDSSWYYYRFLDPYNEEVPFAKDKLIDTTPVSIYIGGKEHAVLHLYYARFMGYFLHSLGWTPSEEPFKKLLVQGMVMGQTYKLKTSGKYIPAHCVEKIGKDYKEKDTGVPVIVQWEKMSKSKHNGENPERLLSTLGCDTTRLLMLADVPPATSRHWSEATLPGVTNWQHRLWLTIREFINHKNNCSLFRFNDLTDEEFTKYEQKLWDSRNYFIATTTYHFRHTQKLSVGISRMQSLTSVLRNKIPLQVMARSKEFEISLASLIIMLAPVTPHFSSELWAGFLSAPNRICEELHYRNKSVLQQNWPRVDDDYGLSFQCKVDGSDKADIKVKASELANLTEDMAVEMMVKEAAVAKRIKRGIKNTKFELYTGCRAILHIFTDRPMQEKQKQKAQSTCILND